VITHDSYEKLNTALYDNTSPRLFNDPVFGTKTSLVKEFKWIENQVEAAKYNTRTFQRNVDEKLSEGYWLLEHDFILAEKQQKTELKTHL
jgi:hypothetical protein